MTEEQIFLIVKLALDEDDPERLLNLGAPADEYDPEAKLITQRIRQEMGIRPSIHTSIPSANAIWMIVCVILHWQYHMLSEPVLYWAGHKPLAQVIYDELFALRRQEIDGQFKDFYDQEPESPARA